MRGLVYTFQCQREVARTLGTKYGRNPGTMFASNPYLADMYSGVAAPVS